MTEQPPIPRPGEDLPSIPAGAAPATPAPQSGAASSQIASTGVELTDPTAAEIQAAELPSADSAVASVDGTAVSPIDRPEVAVGAAFAGGLLLALILRRLAR